MTSVQWKKRITLLLGFAVVALATRTLWFSLAVLESSKNVGVLSTWGEQPKAGSADVPTVAHVSAPTTSITAPGVTTPEQQQCQIPENHTLMHENWLAFVNKKKFHKGVLADGVYYPDWYPTMDCPAAWIVALPVKNQSNVNVTQAPQRYVRFTGSARVSTRGF
jgi:hypothetical protein